ncbi:MAG: type II toxin-antitoxin system HicB family antitoxin [Thaumarchaeota archaeon]|nr:type II toxin-antitoxin system HicB family antitoxin [Nitrososphaerota archaeon]
MAEQRHVIMYRGEDGYWVVECPSLPGCVSQGKTKNEALANIQEAIEAYVDSMRKHGEPVPSNRKVETVAVQV